MDRLLVGLGALVTWAVTSAALFVFCVLSVNEKIIGAAVVVIGGCLVGSVIAIALKRDGLGFVLAAGPGLVAGAILGWAYGASVLMF